MELAEEIKTMRESLTETLKAAQVAQASNDELSKKYDGKLEATDTTVKKAAEESAKALEVAQALKLKIDSVEKTAKYIETVISRMPGAGDGEQNEMEKKAGEQTAQYLRTKRPMDADVVESVVRALTNKSFYGVDDSRREVEIKTLIAGNNPEGGYFIRPERSAKMIKRIFETSPMRSLADIQSTSSDVLEILIDDEEAASGGWVGEVDPRAETGTPGIGKLTIPIHEQFAQPKATQKMLDDAGFDIESWLAGKVTRKMTRVENTSFILGDGSQKPKGILTLAPWNTPGEYQRDAIEQINSGVSGEFTADGLKKIQNSLIEEYQGSAIWGLRRASFESIITLKDGTGAYLLDPRSMKVGDTMILLGKTVIFMNDMPDIAADSLSMVYGDFGVGYTIVDRIGFRVIRDNITNKGNVLFYTTKRTGAAPTSYESYKIQKLAA